MVATRGECGGDCGDAVLLVAMAATCTLCQLRIRFHEKCTHIFWIATTSNYFWSSVVRVVKVDYFDFSCKIF